MVGVVCDPLVLHGSFFDLIDDDHVHFSFPELSFNASCFSTAEARFTGVISVKPRGPIVPQ